MAGAAKAYGQDTLQTLDTINISITRSTTNAAKTPVAISIVQRDRIQGAKLGVTLDESLVEVPGILVSNRYNFAQGPRISMRGFGARAAFGVRGVRIIADGIPLTMPDGQANLNNLDLASADRIEVLRGGSSMLYGNASGGVVAINSETPDAGFHAEARLGLGSMGSGDLANLRKYNLKGGGGSTRTRYLLSATHLRSDGFRNRSRFEQSNINGRITHVHRDGAVSAFTLNWAGSPLAEDPGALPRDSAERFPEAAAPRNVLTKAGKSGGQAQAAVEYQKQFAGAQLKASLYGVRRSLVNPQTFAYIDLTRSAGGVRTTMNWQNITIGIDADAQRDQRKEYATLNGNPGAAQRDQTDKVTTIGPFARAQIDVSRRFTVTAGARFDHAQFQIEDHFLTDNNDDSAVRTMSAWSPMAGATLYALSSTLYANVATSFQTPTTTEINNSLTPLDPERALSFEIGARTTQRGVAMDAAIYQTRIKDELVSFQTPAVPGRNFFRNAAQTRHRGLEFSASTRLTPAISLATSYTYSDFIYEDDGSATQQNEGHRLPGIPPHHLFARATFERGDVSLEPQLEWSSSYFADDANSAVGTNDGFVLANLIGRAALKDRFELYGGINNVRDERYNGSVVVNAAGGRFFEPGPGRSYFLGFKILLSNRRSA
ncbi:MAG TPA: TonB-dependent receptor [Longimicrobiales bacterium]|nr:TonB-dependent receptor [Longimicrobiales bacterium]